MIVSEIIVEGTSRAFKGTKRGISLKYRCTYGPRKGQVRASPAACNAPININARNTLKKTQRARGSMMTKKARRAKLRNSSREIGILFFTIPASARQRNVTGLWTPDRR